MSVAKRTTNKIVEVIEELPEITISAKGAKEITAHLVALVNHPKLPEVVFHALGAMIQDLFNDASGEAQAAISDHPSYIYNVLLGYGNNIEAINEN